MEEHKTAVSKPLNCWIHQSVLWKLRYKVIQIWWHDYIHVATWKITIWSNSSLVDYTHMKNNFTTDFTTVLHFKSPEIIRYPFSSSLCIHCKYLASSKLQVTVFPMLIQECSSCTNFTASAAGRLVKFTRFQYTICRCQFKECTVFVQ